MAKGGHGEKHETHVAPHPLVHVPHVEQGGHGPDIGGDWWKKMKSFFKSLVEAKPHIPTAIAATGLYLTMSLPLGESMLWGFQTGVDTRERFPSFFSQSSGGKGGGHGH